MAVSFADIAQLGIQGEPDQIEWEQYQDSQAIQPPPPDGVYTVQAPEKIFFDKWSKDGRDFLKIAAGQGETGPLVITDEGAAKGVKLFYPFITTRKYKNKMGSAFGDYLRSFGIFAQPKSDVEYAQLAQATAGRFAKVATKQEGYCKACDQTVFEGQASFNGATSAKCPHCGNTVYARAKVDRFISAAV